MKTKLLFFCFLLSLLFTANAQRLTINEPTNYTNEWDYAADCVARLCPAPLWDNWIFKDIRFDRDTNTMYMVVERPYRDKGQELSDSQVKERAEWMVRNIEEGYRDIISSSSLLIDGDWMVYLTLGNLLPKLAENNVNLQFVFVKPLRDNIIDKDANFKLTPDQLRKIIATPE